MARAYIEYRPESPEQKKKRECKPSIPGFGNTIDGMAAVCQHCDKKFVLTFYSSEEWGNGTWVWQPVKWYSWYRRIKFNKAVNG